MEKLYRFSPIGNKDQLKQAIEYTHLACFKLSKLVFGKYLPVAGNIGVFCHYDHEYKFLTDIRKELTYESDTMFTKYYHLEEPIVIPPKEDISETTYTLLYIR